MNPQSKVTEAGPPRFDTSASLFNDIGKSYQDIFKDVPGQQKSIQWLLEHLPQGGAQVLDVGCGTGRPTAEILSAAHHKVTGIDVSPTMVDVAREQVPSATFHLTDALQYDPQGTQYDAVTSYFAFIDHQTRAEAREILARIASWIRPGGYFVYGTAVEDFNETWLTWMGRQITLTSLPREECFDILKKNELEILHSEEAKFQPHADTWEECHLFVYARKK